MTVTIPLWLVQGAAEFVALCVMGFATGLCIGCGVRFVLWIKRK